MGKLKKSFARKTLNIDHILKRFIEFSESVDEKEKKEYLEEVYVIRSENFWKHIPYRIKEREQQLDKFRALTILVNEECKCLELDLEYLQEIASLKEKYRSN